MNNLEVFKVIVISALVTVALRLLPLFVKIPKNPIMNKFFEALPYSVLALMVFPDIFTSGGTAPYDIVKILKQLRSRTESVNDFPNIEKYYLLKIEELNVYIYENDKKYYVEVPYNAIYLINKIQYNKLLEIVK